MGIASRLACKMCLVVVKLSLEKYREKFSDIAKQCITGEIRRVGAMKREGNTYMVE